ncbi:ABC transporter permease [Roseivirga sp. E12]|uniref:ABC transporter permease n=1 Tax=Roseivirga sp. E12 TaxID=2819237 RepID=UPI001ABD1B88|nr:ABC transporter permease [Roseivirga sp. E12]MBO3700664.1 ABC transporter permease [Roseivirga sp. E12]
MNNALGTYIKTAVRSLNKHRLSAVINIAGLSIGFASCLLITFYIQQETSYDKFYKDSSHIYRLNTNWGQEGADEKFATTPPPLAPHLAEISPGVQAITRVYKGGDFTMRADHDFESPFRETNAWMVEDGFLDVLDHGVLAGNRETMFSQPRSVVMPKSTAIRYFGKEAFETGNIVGRSLGGGGDGGTKWLVTGVLPDQPENSHFQFDMLLTPENDVVLNQPNWGWLAFYTYIRLKDNTAESLKNLDGQLESIVGDHAVKHFDVDLEELRSQGLDMSYSWQSIESIHLKSSLLREMRPNGNITYVQAMIAIAVFIIILACVNFINLTTARSAVRAKEIGVRKVLGSQRGQLICQFLTESLLMSFIALLVAFGLIEFLSETLAPQFGWIIKTSFIRQADVLIAIISLTIALGLIAGLYPALYLTRFKPSQVLKGNVSSGPGEKRIRNGLVTFQFVVSMTLIVSTAIINRQVDYIQRKDLGFDKENVIVIQNDREIDERRNEFKNALKLKPGLLSASFTTGIPGLAQYMRRDFTLEGSSLSTGLTWFEVDESFLQTMEVELLEGRGFDPLIASDSMALILNQTAAKELRLEEPIGKFITINQGANDERRVQVIGVIKDLNLQSFDRAVSGLALEYLDNFDFKDYITIRIAPGDLEQHIEALATSWSEFEPNVPMVYSFLDSDFDKLFKSELRLSKVFNGFTALAIVIACLGLFGLASFTSNQRIKEISIRKVLGATTSSLLSLLFKGYFRLIIVAFIFASVIAYGLMNNWLSNFAYRTDLGLQPFGLAFLGTILIAALTVIYHSLKTVSSNPIENLKDE